MKKILLSFLALAAFSTKSAAQCSMLQVSLADKVNNSSLIVEAKVTAKQSFWNAGHNYIYTSNLLEVYKVFKGTTVSTQIEVITEGGEVDLTRQMVDPSLQLLPGETGVFALNPSTLAAQYGKQVFKPYADIQGFFKYDITGNGPARTPFAVYNSVENDLYPLITQATGQGIIVLQANTSSQRVISPNSTQATISSFSPTSITAGTATSLTITGVGFGATQGTSFVEFPDADAGSGYIQPHASQYVSWSNTQIVVQVPTKTSGSGTAGTGQIRVNTTGTPTLSAQTLTVNYGHLNLLYTNTLTTQQVFNTRHVELNGMGGITWQMYTGFDANAAAKASFQRAFQTWRCATLINWALGPTVSTNSIGLDGVDVIRFDIASELPAGVLGRCTSYWNGCYTGTVVSFFVSELDICFDDAAAGYTWQYGPTNAGATEIDFQSVTVHELGHGHQLSHVINTADVMHYAIANGQTKRALNTDDINGGLAVMARNGTGGVCGYNMMVALSPTACAAGTPTAAFNISPSATICAGQSITLTDASVGTPVSWSWTLTGGAPATSTVQNPVVNYASPGTYSITLVSTNGFGSSTPLTKTISVIAAPSVSVSGSTSICSGTSATITASGASTYTWQPGNLTGTSQTFTPSATTPYTVTGSNGVCTNAKTFTISVTATPTLALGSATICSGAVATLTASGASGYTWNPGSLTGASQTFTPSSTTAYTVTGNNGICFSNKTTTIVVNPTPTVNVISLSSSTICSGKSIAVNASGATSYTWNPGPLTGSSQTLSPASTTIYTVNGSNGTCTGTKLYTVTVNPTPTITGVTNPTVCVGQTINLTSAGGGTYSWNGPLGYTSGAQNPSIANATTGMAGQYTLVVTSSVGSCTSSANASVTVNALPTASVSSNSPVCSGNTLNLSGSGGSTYQWNGPNSFSSTSQNPSITNVDAAANGTYTLVVTAAASCSATAVVSVTIAATPTIATVSTPTMICTGQTATLSSTGSAGSYTYAPGNMTVNPAPVTPSVSTTYTASSTVGACTGTAMVSVSVSACTGIETYAVNGTISAYPNPAQNSITVVFGRNLSGKITVYNSIGQDILSKTVSEAPQATLDLSQFAKGMYLLHVSPESGKENIIRIIKD